MSVIKGKNVQIERVSIVAPIQKPGTPVDASRAQLVYVNYQPTGEIGSKKPGRFNIQTPPMELAWDLSCYDEGAYPKYSMELSFKGMDEDSINGRAMKGLHDKMLELETKLVQEGVANAGKWFGLPAKQRTTDVVSTKFGNIIRVSKDKETGEPDGKWPSSIRLKLPYRDGIFSSKLMSPSGDQYKINTSDSGDNIDNIIVKGATAKCIIQCVGLWITKASLTCQWQLVRAEIEPPDDQIGDDFLPDSDNEEDDNEVPTPSTDKFKDSDSDSESD